MPENDPITELTRVPRWTRGNVGGGVGPRMLDPSRQYPPPDTTSYDTGTQEGHPKSTNNFQCRTAHSKHQNALPGTSPSEKRQLGQAALSATDAQAIANVASVPASAGGASHPDVESTEVIIATNLLPV